MKMLTLFGIVITDNEVEFSDDMSIAQVFDETEVKQSYFTMIHAGQIKRVRM